MIYARPERTDHSFTDGTDAFHAPCFVPWPLNVLCCWLAFGSSAAFSRSLFICMLFFTEQLQGRQSGPHAVF